MTTTTLRPAPMTSTDIHEESLRRLAVGATARGLTPVLTLAQSVWPTPRSCWHAATRSGSLLIGNLEVATPDEAATVLALAPAYELDVWLDGSSKGPASQQYRDLLADHPEVGCYSDLAIWADAVLALVLHHRRPSPAEELLLVGASPLTDAVAQRGLSFGFDVVRSLAILGAEPGQLTLIGTSFHTPVIDAPALEAIAADGVQPLCIDGGIGTFTSAALDYVREQGWPVWRPDMRGALAAAITQGRQYRTLLTRHAGTRSAAGITLVAGGLLGPAGALVVDRLDDPGEVLGWADGQGGLISETTNPVWLEARARFEAELPAHGA